MHGLGRIIAMNTPTPRSNHDKRFFTIDEYGDAETALAAAEGAAARIAAQFGTTLEPHEHYDILSFHYGYLILPKATTPTTENDDAVA